MAKNDIKKTLIELKLNTESLTKKDIKTWRNAWQIAIDVDSPLRSPLYNVYTDVTADLHLTGCISQRCGMVLRKSFKIVNKKDGKELPETTELFEAEWFKDFLKMSLDSIYWGHSLIQLGNVISGDMMMFDNVELVPRKHVIPEYGVITKDEGDDWRRGTSYREGTIADWCIEVGRPKDLGLLLKCCPSALSKKNMLAYWDAFGEVFGMPIRIGKTISRDDKDLKRIEKFLSEMGALSWGLFPDGTEIDIKETTRGDAFEVYDKRINRSNSEMSKGILNQTMTIDDGSSKSQSEVHLEVFKNLIESDADMLRDVINWKLIPKMIKHGFKVENCRFDWDQSIDWTPEQQIEIEQMILESYDVEPKYFAEKYNIPIIGKKAITTPVPNLSDFF